MAIDVDVHSKELILSRLSSLARVATDIVENLKEAQRVYTEGAVGENVKTRVDATKELLTSASALNTQLYGELNADDLGTIYPFEVQVQDLDPILGATLETNLSSNYFKFLGAETVMQLFTQGTSTEVMVVGTGTSHDGNQHSVSSYGTSRLNVTSVTEADQTGLLAGGLRVVGYEV